MSMISVNERGWFNLCMLLPQFLLAFRDVNAYNFRQYLRQRAMCEWWHVQCSDRRCVVRVCHGLQRSNMRW